ncbi:MAG: transposase [Gemmatimonadota bacterium]
MPRVRRPHAPGCAFHITARTQGKQRWFTPRLCDWIAEYICDAAASSTTRLLAFCVMPNHVHMIVRQGADPLGWMVQRVLQRTALLVRRTYDHQDHVFGRRYWSGMIDDARYLRQVIIYTHLNAYYAGLCNDPDEYKWSSHGAYTGLAGVAAWSMHVWADHGLRLFSSSPPGAASLRNDYMRFIRYWMRRPKLPLGAKYMFTAEQLPTVPLAEAGDAFFASEYGEIVSALPVPIPVTVDVRDRALTALRAVAPDLTLEEVRGAGRIKELNRVRKHVIAILLTSRCRNGAIARCLNVSTSHVSDVAAAIRCGMTQWNLETLKYGDRSLTDDESRAE